MTPANKKVIFERNQAARRRALALQETSREICATALRLCLEAQYLRRPSVHDLVPLQLAVAAIFRAVYNRAVGHVGSRGTLHLDGLGYAVVAMQPIYTYDGDGKKLRRVTAKETSLGLLRGGAREMHFIDGRPALENLAIAARAVSAVIDVLKRELLPR